MDLRRVVYVRSTGQRREGTGYLVRSGRRDLVLTAAHVVGQPGETCQVRVRGAGVFVDARVCWQSTNADVAVLALDAVLDGDFGREPEWANCEHADLPCSSIGYPSFQVDGIKPDTEQFEGRLRPYSGLERGELNIVHSTSPRPHTDWKGMSGAVVFANGLLVGIITQVNVERFLAWPVARLFDEVSFVAEFGVELRARLREHVLWPDADRGVLDCVLDWTPLPLPSERQPSKLLSPDYEIVPFADELRTRELSALEAFTVNDGPGILIVTGPGGSGKTRLLIEWTKRVRARQWIAGFVDPQIMDLRVAAQGVTPRLLVIDYAMAQVERLTQLVPDLAQ